MTRLSRLGLALAGFYLITSALCVAAALANSGDHKGSFVFLQVPIALQASALQSLGLTKALSGLGWYSAYSLLALPTVLLLYGCGAFLGKLAGRTRT